MTFDPITNRLQLCFTSSTVKDTSWVPNAHCHTIIIHFSNEDNLTIKDKIAAGVYNYFESSTIEYPIHFTQ